MSGLELGEEALDTHFVRALRLAHRETEGRRFPSIHRYYPAVFDDTVDPEVRWISRFDLAHICHLGLDPDLLPGYRRLGNDLQVGDIENRLRQLAAPRYSEDRESGDRDGVDYLLAVFLDATCRERNPHVQRTVESPELNRPPMDVITFQPRLPD